jgi:hypothetical protein
VWGHPRPPEAILCRLRVLPPLQCALSNTDHLARRVLACPLSDSLSHQVQTWRRSNSVTMRPVSVSQIMSTFFGESTARSPRPTHYLSHNLALQQADGLITCIFLLVSLVVKRSLTSARHSMIWAKYKTLFVSDTGLTRSRLTLPTRAFSRASRRPFHTTSLGEGERSPYHTPKAMWVAVLRVTPASSPTEVIVRFPRVRILVEKTCTTPILTQGASL